jgi:hypothetical protein
VQALHALEQALQAIRLQRTQSTMPR